MSHIKRAGAVALAFVLAVSAAAYAAGREPLKGDSFAMPDTSAMEVGSNRHALYEEAALSGEKVENRLDTQGYEKKMESGALEIWFRKEIDSIRVVDKRSGYVWGSLKEDKPEGLNQKWTAMANSLCTLEYFDSKGKEKKVGLSESSAGTVYQWKNNSLHCKVTLKKEQLSLAFTMELKDDCLRFTVDKGSLQEEGDCKMKSLYFVPFLGCTESDELDGYMFVPDGPGTLIRYRSPTKYISTFEKKIYGADMGIDPLAEANDLMANRTNDFMVEAPQITMPVFGTVHGAYQNGILTVVEQGEEYASILATPAGAIGNYNWAAARFDYRQTYMHPTSKDGVGVYRPQDDRNEMTPQISFTFLTGEEADYSGMAVRYRGMLEEQGVLGKERADAQMPLLLNVLGSDVKTQFLINGQEAFTTFAQAQELVEKLRAQGIENLTLRYEGWQKGGVNGSKYGTTRHEGKLGSWEELVSLKDGVQSQGGRFFLDFNPITATSDQISTSFQTATTYSKTAAKFVRPNTKVMYYERFLLRPDLAADMLKNSAGALPDISFSFKELGSRLYADRTRDHKSTRSETCALFLQALEVYGDRPLALDTPNKYLWGNVTDYTNMPVVSSQYLFETDTVPFLQIVLKGSIDSYAPYANLGFSSEYSILKMVEYGLYPSFVTAACQNSDLQNTPQADLFSVNYGDWEETIGKVYQKISPALQAVEGCQITRHRMVAPGVACVAYSNGVKIYVNYNSSDYSGGGVTVPGLSYEVRGGNV